MSHENVQSWSPMAGGCYCKNVRYELTQPPIFTNCCHCRNCQALSGSAFAINAQVKATALRITSDVQPLRIKDTSAGSVRCEQCGTLLWAFIPMFGDTVAFLRAGTLDEAEKIQPNAHFFTRSKHPWITIPQGVQSYETFPEKGEVLYDDDAKARIVMAQQE